MRLRWKFVDRKDLFSLRLRRETVKRTGAQAYTVGCGSLDARYLGWLTSFDSQGAVQ